MLEPCARFSQLVWKTIDIEHITFQVMDLICILFSGYVASVSCLRVLAETVSRFVDQVVFCVPF